jgi:hypothetical protein
MPTTYSPSLRIALLGNGENSGTWGQLTNTTSWSIINNTQNPGWVELDDSQG